MGIRERREVELEEVTEEEGEKEERTWEVRQECVSN